MTPLGARKVSVPGGALRISGGMLDLRVCLSPGHHAMWVTGSTVRGFVALRFRVPLPLRWLSYRHMTWVLVSVSVPPRL